MYSHEGFLSKVQTSLQPFYCCSMFLSVHSFEVFKFPLDGGKPIDSIQFEQLPIREGVTLKIDGIN